MTEVAYKFHGHAIVSDDDMIADAEGNMPQSLINISDFTRFQRELDRAAAIIVGRKGHEAHPDKHKRNRIVVSSSADGIEQRADAWWWNPAQASLDELLNRTVPRGGIIAVPGGRRVFDLFLEHGYDEFHLVRMRGVNVPAGIPVFSECSTGRSAEEVLAAHGLVPVPSEVLDATARVAVTVWQRKRLY
jgi:dihydrofolate reductase